MRAIEKENEALQHEVATLKQELAELKSLKEGLAAQQAQIAQKIDEPLLHTAGTQFLKGIGFHWSQKVLRMET